MGYNNLILMTHSFFVSSHPRKAFTLIELLVVIAIIAILAVVVVLTLNPAQMLAQARDSNRLSDLTTMNSAINLYTEDAGGSGSLGTAGITYISIPDPTASTTAGSNCSALGFPPTGYHCAGPNFYHRNDGTGWIPVNFSAMSMGVPLATLPVDPVNSSSSGQYYRYTTGASTGWTLSAVPESVKYGSLAASFQIGWTCGSPLVDSRDGQSYATVLIGSQCWMAQNLNVGNQITSCTGQSIDVSITTACTPLQNQGTSTSSIQKYCYANLSANCTAQGGLYQWNQAMGGSTSTTGFGVTGICPANWHLPTDAEYQTLEIYLGMCSGTGSVGNYCANDANQWRGTTQGTQLKSGGTSGFNGLLAGLRSTDGSFNYQSSGALFWSSLVSGGSAWSRYLSSGLPTVYRYSTNQLNGFSARCVEN